MEESVNTINFVVHGKPSPSGSKKAFQHSKTGRIVVIDTAKGKDKWQNASKRAAMEAVKQARWEITSGPVALHVSFVFARPKSHYRTGRNSNILKDTAPAYHIQKPDRTKLLRCIEDPFTGVLWTDDSQVIDGNVTKQWGEVDSAHVTVVRIS